MLQTLHFPSEEKMISYLEGHPLTSDSYLKENKILEAVAKVFAGQKKDSVYIGMDLMSTLCETLQKLKIPRAEAMKIKANLTRALLDCANGTLLVSKL